MLLAILETRRAGSHESEYFGAHDTIAIAGIDGYAIARATFVPRHIPEVGFAAPVLYPEAIVAAGGVYFIDGTGVVRRLDPSGSTRKITTFPIATAQQGVSFAVSPDGKHLMAAVLTYPTLAPAPSPTPGPELGTPFVATSPWKLDLELAADGGTAAVLHHWQSGPNDSPGSAAGFRNLAVVGWDNGGPIGVIDGYSGAQQTLFDGQRWAGGYFIRLGLDGKLGATALPAACQAVAIDGAGRVVCIRPGASGSPGQLQVARVDGQVPWTAPQPPAPAAQLGQAGGFALSPDGSRLAMNGVLIPQHGVNQALSDHFLTRGWLSNDTLIGLVPGTEPMKIGILRLSSPNSIENWGFTGQFVGLLGS